MEPGGITLIAHTPDHLRALLEGRGIYELRFQIVVAAGVKDFLCGPEVSESFLKRLREARSSDPWLDGFGVLQLAEKRLVGLCNFNGPPNDEGAVEISYGIAPAYQGRGYATAAAQLLIERAFADKRVQLVRAYTLPEENASTRVLQKCGLQNRGEVIDEVDGRIWQWELRRDQAAR